MRHFLKCEEFTMWWGMRMDYSHGYLITMQSIISSQKEMLKWQDLLKLNMYL